MMLPLLFSKKGRAAWTRVCRPSISIWNIVFQAAGSSWPFRPEALATMTSIPPLCSADCLTQSWICFSSVKSSVEPMAFVFGKSEQYFSVADLTSSAVRAQKWTMAPSSRKPLTISRPMPLVPPTCASDFRLSGRHAFSTHLSPERPSFRVRDALLINFQSS